MAITPKLVTQATMEQCSTSPEIESTSPFKTFDQPYFSYRCATPETNGSRSPVSKSKIRMFECKHSVTMLHRYRLLGDRPAQEGIGF